MNKEYTFIDDNEFMVTDENGNTVKRSIDSKNVHKLLLLENKLEQVNSVANNAQKKIDLLSYEPSIKRRLLFYFFPLIITLFGAGVTLALSTFNSLFGSFIDALIASAIWSGTTSLGYELGIKKFQKKYLRGYEKQLKAALGLKKYYEERISDEKSLTKENNNEIKEDEKNIINIGDVVSLEKENKINYSKISAYLDDCYDKGCSEKVKKLVLKKK